MVIVRITSPGTKKPRSVAGRLYSIQNCGGEGDMAEEFTDLIEARSSQIISASRWQPISMFTFVTRVVPGNGVPMRIPMDC